ncbi:hypothetical protein EVJ58_g2593 [Rhodofomes roseus]|uniref:SET domain-containing protein n=1 Tax=Rhodofomes roseus TaxID=34475 RepID=A0A4Y9YQS5_9APHY|nr:hypothetical protein EVJ58_g2593 [Rhodofomes roseus]
MAQMGITPEELAGFMSQFDPSATAARDSLDDSPYDHPPQLSFAATPETIKKYKAWYERDSKKSPTAAPTVPPRLLVQAQEQQREKQEREALAAENGISTRMTVIGFPKHSCKVQLGALKPTKSVSIQTIVEDVNGAAQVLSIYNFPTTYEASLAYIDLLFPVGIAMAILEPTFKVATQGGNPHIRVDSPTDIVFLDPRSDVLRDVHWKTGSQVSRFNAWPSDSDHWKARGNNYFAAGHWLPAAFAYSRGLQCDPDSLALRSNRSEAYLRLNFYSAASADARYVRCAAGAELLLRQKALFREAKAEYGRGRYQKAKSLLEQLHSSRADDSDIVKWIARCTQRLHESLTGVYDWTLLYKQSQTDPHLDVAEYTGPIEVRPMSNRGGGRGIAATRVIDVGELLVVAKPLSLATDAELQSLVLQKTVNLLTSKMDKRSQSANVAYAAQAIYGNPDLHDHAFHLYAGPDYPPPPSSFPPPPVDEPTELDPLKPRHRIDLAQLESICTHNAFGVMPLRPEDRRKPDDLDKLDSSTGLYPLPSLFNHSCAPNSHIVFIGDIMMMRASRTIHRDEEVTSAYMTPTTSYFERRKTLQEGWLMSEICDCRQCQYDRADGEANLRHRGRIAEGFSVDLFSKPLAKLRSLQKKLSATYVAARGPSHPSPALYPLHHAIAETLRSSHTTAGMKDAIKEDMKALEYRGWSVTDDDIGRRSKKARSLNRRGEELAVDTSFLGDPAEPLQAIPPMLRVAQTYFLCDDMMNATRWIKTAQWVLNTSVGGGKELFMMIERPLLKQFDLLDVATRVL